MSHLDAADMPLPHRIFLSRTCRFARCERALKKYRNIIRKLVQKQYISILGNSFFFALITNSQKNYFISCLSFGILIQD